MVQHRGAQLVQAGVCQVEVGLDTGCPRRAEAGRPFGDIVEQGGLADAGLATQYEDLTLARAGSVDHAI